MPSRYKTKGVKLLIYLDNAATTFVKPETVAAAVSEASRRLSGNPGRGAHSVSLAASQAVCDCRIKLARMFGTAPERIIFTYNTTYALNIALKASYIYGSRILISDLEHNSVLRPSAALTGSCFSGYDLYDSFPELCGKARTAAILSSIRSLMKPLTRTLVCCARSNINGLKQPIREIGRYCREMGLFFIVDAAQSAGYDSIDVEADCIDALCLPGHKGLYGPQGTGVIALSENAVRSARINTFIEGGSGYDSLEPAMPREFPERLEGGTLNVPGIHGLAAGVDFVCGYTPEKLAAHESALARRTHERLSELRGVKCYGYSEDSNILLFNLVGIPCETVCRRLDERGICVRGGYHCAPLAHKRLGTPAGGAVRVSFGAFNTESDVDALAEALVGIKNAE